jgi:hypothetical protein
MQASKAPYLSQRQADFPLRVMRAAIGAWLEPLSLCVSAYLPDSRETARFVLLSAVNDCEGPGWPGIGRQHSLLRNIPG